MSWQYEIVRMQELADCRLVMDRVGFRVYRPTAKSAKWPQQCQPASLYCEAKQHTENKGPVGPEDMGWGCGFGV